MSSTNARPLIGRRVVRLAEAASTNDVAARLAREDADEGTVVWADRQTEGRGRRGRGWFCLPGKSLCASVILRPALDRDHWGLLGMTAALAVRRAAGAWGVCAAVKWPNDVVCGSRKLAGVLAETVADAAIVGIGCNVNGTPDEFPPELQASVTTLEAQRGEAVDIAAFAAALWSALDDLYQALLEQPAAVLDEWRAADALAGQPVAVQTPQGTVAGTHAGVDEAGALLLEVGDGGTVRLLSGEVSVRGVVRPSAPS